MAKILRWSATKNVVSRWLALIAAFIVQVSVCAEAPKVLPGTEPLNMQGDLSAQMVAGIDRFLLQEIERSVKERAKKWNRNFSSTAAYEKSVEPNRERLRKIIGAVEERVAANPEKLNESSNANVLAKSERFTIRSIRWPVFEGVFAEGLWLLPSEKARAQVVALPDADQTPEMLAGLQPGLAQERQFARRLAENGCEVLVLTLVDRQDNWSGSERLKRFTNQPHREWIYRQAYELGRHIIGYEVQKVLGAVDLLAPGNEKNAQSKKVGVIGYGEGGLIALYAAALDRRIDAALVSGYFDSRQGVWEEPIYRNVFGLLSEFGDAELATLVAPRNLIVEHSAAPKVDGPPKAREGRSGAAPGKLKITDYASVEAELERARSLLKGADPKAFDHFTLISGTEGMATGPGSDRALAALLNSLGIPGEQLRTPAELTILTNAPDVAERQQRQVKELEEHTQKTFRESEQARADFIWNKVQAANPEAWRNGQQSYRKIFGEEVIGRFSSSAIGTKARLRPLELSATPISSNSAIAKNWTGYEVVLDVLPDVFTWGYLLVPKDIQAGERRPVVVCQHGLEGVPADVISEDTTSQAYKYYKAFAVRLAERGFVTFVPHNPYRGGDKFRVLQRKANPLGKSIFSVITAQHERIVGWLANQPFVDPKRIGFYGLSYGGKTAMRVPALLEGYALSICSADFNEWVKKNVSIDFPASYMFSGEYEMPEWDLGHTFNYAEMAALIAPRPFMVERGHHDGVGIDEHVAYEYAKVARFYEQLGIGDRTRIEYFDGPHTINGVGTFAFLHEHLNWPKR